ncbi:MAG: ubiquinone biosynthesis regulatory protein kinase UbiB, partial [Chromatiaceae bacterium]
YRRVAELHVESGWVPPGTRVEEFESAIRTVSEPIFEKPLSEISFGHFLLRLFQTARRFHMEVQPQLVLLQKTLLNIEGLGRQLYPELDLWTTAKPFMERWMKEQVGPKAILDRAWRNLGPFSEQLPELPLLGYKVLSGLEHQTLAVRWRSDELELLRREMRAHRSQMLAAFGGGALILSGTLIIILGPGAILTITAAQVLAGACFAAGGWLLIRVTP